MAGTAPIDDDEVHVLHADEPASRRGRLSLLLGGVALLLVAAAGTWIWLNPQLLEGLGGTVVKPPPPPAADNLLGDAWSFETTETSSASQAWRVAEEAPGGFRFDGAGAVSGELGAIANPSLPAGAEPGAGEAGGAGDAAGTAPGDRAGENLAGWSRLLSDRAVPLGAHRGAVRLQGATRGANLVLFLRFEGKDRRPIDVLVAQGEGPLDGQVPVPPGTSSVRVGLQCVGNGSADDLVLTFVDEGGEALERRGIFDVLPLRDGLLVYRGDECVLTITGLAPADPRGLLPPPAPARAGEPLPLVLPDGRQLSRTRELGGDARRMQRTETVSGVPAGTVLARTLVVSGSLAEAPLGIVSARGFEQFTGDFRVEGVRSLVLGHTQDRLALEFDADTTLAATRQADGAVIVRAELPPAEGGAVSQQFVVQTSFQEERVAAAQHRDAALAAEQAGQLGTALAEAEIIVTRYPHDEDVLALALALRGRVQALMQQRLDVIDSGLADALFLDSASRCREVLADCTAAAAAFAGSEAAERFHERARSVEQRAASLLEEDRARRAGRLSAVLESFRADGHYPDVAAEIEDTLQRFLPPPAAAGSGDGGDAANATSASSAAQGGNGAGDAGDGR